MKIFAILINVCLTLDILSLSLFLSMRKYITLQNAVIFRLKSFRCDFTVSLSFSYSPHMYMRCIYLFKMCSVLLLRASSCFFLDVSLSLNNIVLPQHILNENAFYYILIWKSFRGIHCWVVVEREIVKVFCCGTYIDDRNINLNWGII